MDPVILFFLLGVIAGLCRSELRLPAAAYELISIVLLLAIGLKGGVELAKQPVLSILPQIGVVAVFGIFLTLLGYPMLRFLGQFSKADAASIAAHYGSVSVGTYAVAVAYLVARGVFFEAHLPVLLVVLEIPAILFGVILAQSQLKQLRWRLVLHEIFTGKGIVLLIGGLLIGWIAGPSKLQSIEPLFFDLFSGVLALFMLEMGLLAAGRVSSLRQYGLFIVLFGLAMPMLSASLGIVLGLWLELSVGGTTLLATLAASASYIAVPAAMRISVPEANPTLSLTASLGITFPFNVLVGIPLYYAVASRVYGV